MTPINEANQTEKRKVRKKNIRAMKNTETVHH